MCLAIFHRECLPRCRIEAALCVFPTFCHFVTPACVDLDASLCMNRTTHWLVRSLLRNPLWRLACCAVGCLPRRISAEPRLGQVYLAHLYLSRTTTRSSVPSTPVSHGRWKLILNLQVLPSFVSQLPSVTLSKLLSTTGKRSTS